MAKPTLTVLSGAGISAESGLRTFRDSGGLWEGYEVSRVASPEGWEENPALVLDFYNQRRRDVLAAAPNAAHEALARLEATYEVTIITQNIDDLHERAGSSRVIHLHGEILKMRGCADPYRLYPVREDIRPGDLAEDGTQLRPHVVWFGEAVPLMEKAAQCFARAERVLVIGTSLNVYPAAGLLNFAPHGAVKYVIDKKTPPLQGYEGLVRIAQPATEGMRRLFAHLMEGAPL